MKIIFYSKTNCHWCEQVRVFLNDNGISFEEKDVTKNQEYFDEMVRKSNQSKAPTLDIGGHILADADVAEVASYLAQKGKIGHKDF